MNANPTAEALFEKAERAAKDDVPAALTLFAECAAAAPDWSAPVAALGNLLRRIGRTDDALVAYGRALELAPDDADIYLSRGNLYNDSREYEAAIIDYERSAEIRPDWYLPDLNRGNALAAQGALDAARAAYDKALLKDGPTGIRLRRDLLLPIVPADAASYADALTKYAAALDTLSEDPPAFQNPLTETPGSRFYLAYHGKNECARQQKLAELYLKGCPILAWTAPHCENVIRRPGPRRIAIVSRFLFDHSIGRLCLGLIQRLCANRDCIVTCFESAPVPDDPIRQEIASHVERMITLPPDLDSARQTIATTEPDLLFYPEIGMDPVVYFLAFARLAPVQTVSFGHPITSGIPSIDYFLSCAGAEPDHPVDPSAHYSEQLETLPGLPFSYARPSVPESTARRSDFGFAEDVQIYFLAQNIFKIHPSMDTALRAILEGDPNGIVVILEGHDPKWGESLRRRFSASLGAHADRAIFLPRQSHDDFMRLLALSDVSLDSFPFCGGNTTYQSLAMGTPVITLPSDQLRGRVSLAIYRHMEFNDLVARDPAHYAEIALSLGMDLDRRRAVEARLERECDKIFDDPTFLDAAEAFLLNARPPLQSAR